ncbi:unnamed protein product [Kluyveromyces dobzhanskii CBS 2104]|uniref:WGS project CCBQ000000000 data, contig 00012 n=1 Tax=Kluyveromyces dobzhanskii CBS 2104 TaxID=1427455 RepID=A0A0A8L301_9SACH|nr:unnamed protein product [Kluyveromyces dobzhanskii CBS 2104]
MNEELLDVIVKPPNVTNNPNYKKLSAMIENYSLNESLGDDEMYMPSKADSSVDKSSPQVSFNSNDPHVRTLNSYGTPQDSPDNHLQLQGFSPGNRGSIISAYSGTVHEGVPVSYIVNNNSTTAVKKEAIEEPTLPPLPSKREWSTASADALSELTSKPSGTSTSHDKGQEGEGELSTLGKKDSLKLLSMEKSHQKVPSSIASGNLASESGHSHNASSTSYSGSSMMNMDNTSQYTGNNGNLPQLSQLESTIKEESTDELQPAPASLNGTRVSDLNNVPEVNVTEAFSATTPLNISQTPSRHEISQVSEINSINSSILPPLETQVNTRKTDGAAPEVEILTDLHPTVPPRSARRPTSHIFIKESLDDIQNQLAKEMGGIHPTNGNPSVWHSRESSNSVRSESFFSATEQDDAADPENETYTTRPLPSIPRSSASKQLTLEGQIIAQAENDHLETGKNAEEEYDENDYEDIDENSSSADKGSDTSKLDSTIPTPQSKLPKTPKKSASKGKSKSKSHQSKAKIGSKNNKELRSFDIDTISQLLNVTKGTLIGSEFSNLGMKIEEKRALERLVDSLSRLTADMVLDPEKYHEGLKRLERATRALDGF